MQPYEELITTVRSDRIDLTQRKAAFDLLVEQFQTRAINWAYQVLHDLQLAQDVAQEAFLMAYQKLDNSANLEPFQASCARLYALIVTASSAANPIKHHSLTRDLRFFLPSLTQRKSSRELTSNRLCWPPLKPLPEHERSVVKLFYLDDYSIQEIADLFALPLTTIPSKREEIWACTESV